jgi:hypothetical protein
MAENLLDLANTGRLGSRPFGEMTPYEILARTLDRAAQVGQGNLTSEITSADVNRWADRIDAAPNAWEEVESIRSDILKWRVGTDQLATTFGLTEAQAEAASEVGGDLAATVMAQGRSYPGSFGGPSGGGGEDLGSAFDAAQGENALVNLQNGFVSALLEAGIGADLAGDLWNWAKGRFTSDPSFTAAQAMIEVYDQPAFKERFPAIDQMRIAGRRDVPTPYEYVQREKWLSGELKRYGMADLGANINTVITDTFVNGVGTAEIQERLAGAARVIFEAPDDVKQTFIDWYGPQGDAALMMTFLDPTDNWGGDWVEVKRNIETSEVGGLSSMILDSRVAKERARSIAALGLQQGAIWDKFATLKEQENLFIERAGETDLDLISHGSAAEFGVEGEEIGGEFLSGFELSDILERRRGTRAAEFAGGGGAMITGSSTGFGAANA